MIKVFMETQRPLATVLAFLATYFLTLAVGRLLKRRAGVHLGIFFQLFAFTLAFYAAISVYGVTVPWRGHVGAVLILLGAAVVVALLDRFLWDYHFEGRRKTPIPRLLRDTVALAIFLVALLLVLSIGYNAQAQLKGLLAGSGVLAIILGFAAQNLLSSILSGMALQIERPYKVGDWLHVGTNFGEVTEINWGTTRVRTNDGIYLLIPNNEIVKQTIINLHYPTSLHAMRLRVGAEYSTPPNRVKDALLRATSHATGVMLDPPPKIFLVDFADSAVTYEVKYWINDHAAYNEITDAIRTNIWYEFRRQKITIPFPIRTVQVDRKTDKAPANQAEYARALLRREPLFSCLSDEQIESLLKGSEMQHFGRGEAIIEEGASGESMFILLRGSAHVTVKKESTQVRVGSLRSGDCFGEMSLLTGEKRTATVRAEKDCEVVEISKPTMGELLRTTPACLDQLSGLLAHRKIETEGIVKEAQVPSEQAQKEREYTASFISRLKSFFEL